MSPARIPEFPDRLINSKDVDRICDVGDVGLAIVRSTSFRTPSEYNPRRGRRVANILNDMFDHDHFAGKRIIELGPGHYGFALLARHLGAEVVCVERDPAFAALGRHLGFEVLEQDFNELEPTQFAELLDGLWAKGTFNACTRKGDREVAEFVNRVSAVIKPDGWAWFVTVNKTEKAPTDWINEDFVRHRVEVQRMAFAERGWDVALIPDDQRSRYALKYSNSLYLYTRALRITGAERVTHPVSIGAPATTTARDPESWLCGYRS